MAVGKHKKVIWGFAAVLFFTACALIGGSGNTETIDSTSTMIVSPTPNLTVTAVFANATANATIIEEEPTETGSEEDAASTETPDAESTEAPADVSEEVPYASTPAVAVDGGVEAYYLDDAPVIDADLTDWDAEMYSMPYVVYGSEYYANEADLSGQFKVGWDSTYLYLGVVVFDTRYTQTSTGNLLYLGDSLEILLDTDLTGDETVEELNGDDYQIGISAGNLHDVVIPEAFMWYPSSRMASLTTVEIAGALIENGWVVEVAIPWSEVGVTPADSMTFGFLLSISDNDMQYTNAQQSVVSFSEGRELQNPTSWSELLLINP